MFERLKEMNRLGKNSPAIKAYSYFLYSSLILVPPAIAILFFITATDPEGILSTLGLQFSTPLAIIASVILGIVTFLGGYFEFVINRELPLHKVFFEGDKKKVRNLLWFLAFALAFITTYTIVEFSVAVLIGNILLAIFFIIYIARFNELDYGDNHSGRTFVKNPDKQTYND